MKMHLPREASTPLAGNGQLTGLPLSSAEYHPSSSSSSTAVIEAEPRYPQRRRWCPGRTSSLAPAPPQHLDGAAARPVVASATPAWTLSGQLARRRLRAMAARSAVQPEQETRCSKQCWKEGCKEGFFWVLFGMLCIGCGVHLVMLAARRDSQFQRFLVLESIPIVGVIFTWGHIWLAVQMMFYPVKFVGLWNYRNSGYGLGWQGVVPRKAGIMAERSCDLMIGRLIKMEEIVDRFEMDEFFETLGKVMVECQQGVNEKLGQIHFPGIWPKLPKSVKDEILLKTMDTQRDSFNALKSGIRGRISTILDIKAMTVQHFTENPTLLIRLFQHVGRKEFRFIQRCGAQMGLVLGVIQMGLFFVTKDIKWMPWVLLPLSGLIIGNFTNWLAIKMIFRPIHPHYFCGINVQGVFLKRQELASRELAAMLSDTCVNSEHMIGYLVTSPGLHDVMNIMEQQISEALQIIGGSLTRVLPLVVGVDLNVLKKDVIECLFEELPKHKKQLLKYMDKAIQIEELIASRLAALPPDEFEGMLHPVFEEDEWMLIVLGGVLGVVVGLFQALVLRY